MRLSSGDAPRSLLLSLRWPALVQVTTIRSQFAGLQCGNGFQRVQSGWLRRVQVKVREPRLEQLSPSGSGARVTSRTNARDSNMRSHATVRVACTALCAGGGTRLSLDNSARHLVAAEVSTLRLPPPRRCLSTWIDLHPLPSSQQLHVGSRVYDYYIYTRTITNKRLQLCVGTVVMTAVVPGYSCNG